MIRYSHQILTNSHSIFKAQLAIAYSTAFAITKKDKYKEVVDDIMLYVSRDMTHTSGGFYAAEDADSYPKGQSDHKKEGAFCVWNWEETRQLLDIPVEGMGETTLADVVCHEYNMKEGGNVNPRGDPHGELKNQNVLTKLPIRPPLFDDVEKYKSGLLQAKEIMFQERLTRPRPGLDSKILCSWNALMISAYCRAGSMLNNSEYIDVANKAGSFIRDVLWSTDKKILLRSIYGADKELKQIENPIEGFIDDYCFTVQAFLDLYQATLNEEWLSLAVTVQSSQDALFLDHEKGGYFASKEGDPEIVLRLKDDQDGAEPSSNSVAAINMFRLGKILNQLKYTLEGEKIIKLFNERLKQIPHAMPALVEALLFHLQDKPIIVITGEQSSDNAIENFIKSSHLPSFTVIGSGDLTKSAHPALSSVDCTQPGAYILKNGELSGLITSNDQMKSMLKKN